ncbi:hypothetical protein B0H14DRAFT_2774458 [Mycena olivaceomarginata]|nr:hypothetical protein B0H14DRAFT_2774458 [Mycena olivaceomarginata]
MPILLSCFLVSFWCCSWLHSVARIVPSDDSDNPTPPLPTSAQQDSGLVLHFGLQARTYSPLARSFVSSPFPFRIRLL